MTKIQTQFTNKTTEETNLSVAVLIVAAGRGSRACTSLPKQYCTLAGKPVLTRTIESIQSALPGVHVITITHPDDETLFAKATDGLSGVAHVHGGSTRQESVYKGLQALAAAPPQYVLIHDAARPFVSSSIIHTLIAGLKAGTDALVPAVAITDTLKRTTGTLITDTVDRADLYSVQTPQAFKFDKLLEAHTVAPHKNFTDDAAVFEHSGNPVQICTGNSYNFKLTTPEDFQKAEAHIMMSCADIRVGSGYDVHQFETGTSLWLCGVEIPFTKSLKGHSDADVALHALTDAILASISTGDIGTHFPPTDKTWRRTKSHVFLQHAAKLVGSKGGTIAHVTVCIICEKPKIGPHKDTMRARIADILQISQDRVSVQATTTEKLGFTGREEGIAAQATATVRLPFEVTS